MKISFNDTIALSGFVLAIISMVSAFVFWLVSLSYKITKFIYGIKADVVEISHAKQRIEDAIALIGKDIEHLNRVISREFPQYFNNRHE